MLDPTSREPTVCQAPPLTKQAATRCFFDCILVDSILPRIRPARSCHASPLRQMVKGASVRRSHGGDRRSHRGDLPSAAKTNPSTRAQNDKSIELYTTSLPLVFITTTNNKATMAVSYCGECRGVALSCGIMCWKQATTVGRRSDAVPSSDRMTPAKYRK